MPAATTSAFEIQQLWVKHVDPCNGNALLDGANILQQPYGSPEHNPPYYVIPPYQPNECGHNFQIEATVKNITAQPLTVKYRIQVCPSTQGGLPLGGPFPSPPCGQLVASGASVTIQPGQTGLLPIWQLQMWSENIRVHNQIVDANTGAVYNAVVDYWDNLDYRADDWFIDLGPSEVITPRWSCVNGQCVQDRNGQFTTLADCAAACQPIPPTPRYSCVSGSCIQDPNGIYTSVESCLAACHPPPPAVRYSCVSGQCVLDPNGPYSSLAACMLICKAPPPTNYSCVSGQCVRDANGPYSSLAACQVACVPPPPVGCASDADCPSGYHCVNGQCVPIVTLPPTWELAAAAVGIGAVGVTAYALNRRKHKQKKTRRKRRKR